MNGTVGVVVPDLAALCSRLQAVAPRLDGTQFRFTDRSDFVEVTCPWGNQFRAHAPSPELGGFEIGMRRQLGDNLSLDLTAYRYRHTRLWAFGGPLMQLRASARFLLGRFSAAGVPAHVHVCSGCGN